MICSVTGVGHPPADHRPKAGKIPLVKIFNTDSDWLWQ